VTDALLLPQNSMAWVVINPLSGTDHGIATWFHAHLTRTFAAVLRVFAEFGSGEWIALVLACLVLFFIWKRWWPSLVTLVVAVPGGMLLNEWLKLAVHRQRPFVAGPFVDWSGYSFASGHTIGATLLYGQLLLFVMPALKTRNWRILTTSGAVLLIAVVGFSRIALGAHFLTDVLAGIILGIAWLLVCFVVVRRMHQRNFRSAAVEAFPALEALSVSEAVLAPVEQPIQQLRIPKAD